jgi:hypothetical protein
MADGARRGLTDGEKAFVRSAFGDRIDLDRVRIRHGAGANPAAAVALRFADAVTMIDTIHFRDPPPADFSLSGARWLFLHEMTHVWQYQTLGAVRFYWRYLREWTKCRFDRHAMYAYQPGEPFAAAMLEAQAEMVRDYGRGGGGKVKACRCLAGTGLYEL